MKTFFKNSNYLVPIEEWEPNCWVCVEDPTDEDKDYLLNNLKIPVAFFNDIEDIDERPRIEEEDGWYLILFRIPVANISISGNLPFNTIPLGIIFKDEIFVSVCFYQNDLISDFIQYSKRKNIIKKNNFDLVLRLILSSSVWYLKYLKQINLKIKLAETQLEKSIKNEELQTLLKIEKCLVFFTTSLKGNEILIHKIRNLKEYKNDYDEDLFEDVEIELRQAQEITKIYSDILSGMMDAYASVISNNLNIVMKLLTSISIMLMIPTLIASFYGMNVPNFVEDSKLAFGLIVVSSFLITILTTLFFKKKNWL